MLASGVQGSATPRYHGAGCFSLNWGVEVDTQVKQFATNLLDEFAWEKSLKTLDALQLTSALVAHQWLPIDYFVSSDRKFLAIAADYFATFNPVSS